MIEKFNPADFLGEPTATAPTAPPVIGEPVVIPSTHEFLAVVKPTPEAVRFEPNAAGQTMLTDRKARLTAQITFVPPEV